MPNCMLSLLAVTYLLATFGSNAACWGHRTIVNTCVAAQYGRPADISVVETTSFARSTLFRSGRFGGRFTAQATDSSRAAGCICAAAVCDCPYPRPTSSLV